MARSLAAVLQEKDSLQRRNKELERAVTPGFESHAGTSTAQDAHSIPWMSGSGSPSLAATDFPLSVRHRNGISPPHASTCARGIDRLPPRSPSMARASYQSAGSPVNQARMVRLVEGSQNVVLLRLTNMLLIFPFSTVTLLHLRNTPSPGITSVAFSIPCCTRRQRNSTTLPRHE